MTVHILQLIQITELLTYFTGWIVFLFFLVTNVSTYAVRSACGVWPLCALLYLGSDLISSSFCSALTFFVSC